MNVKVNDRCYLLLCLSMKLFGQFIDEICGLQWLLRALKGR